MVEQRSRAETIASLLAHGLTEQEIATLAAEDAAAQTHALIRAQQAPARSKRSRRALPPAPSTPPTPPLDLLPPLAPASPPPAPAKERYRIRNWKQYNQALVQRGSLSIWLDQNSISAWLNLEKNGKSGRDYTYADTAILTMLTLKNLFHLPLRATQGLTASILQLAQISLAVPTYSTLSRRAVSLQVRLPRIQPNAPLHVVVDSSGLKVYGEGEWKVRKHGWSKRRRWCKIHIGVDETTQEVVACVVTGRDSGDAEVLPEVLEHIVAPIKQVSVDGAYDTAESYRTIQAHGGIAVIPPRENAVRNEGAEWAARNATLERVAQLGRAGWKEQSGYHRRSLAETAMFRLKTLFGERLSSRREERQRTEGAIRCAALNRMTHLGMPDSYKVAAA